MKLYLTILATVTAAVALLVLVIATFMWLSTFAPVAAGIWLAVWFIVIISTFIYEFER